VRCDPYGPAVGDAHRYGGDEKGEEASGPAHVCGKRCSSNEWMPLIGRELRRKNKDFDF
jgi:hypothetical protein